MSQIYLIRDQHDRFLDKSGDWSHGEDARGLYRSNHKDEAINQMVELSVKNPELRVRIEPAERDEKGLPKITPLPCTPQNDCEEVANDDQQSLLSTPEEQQTQATA
ncbi:hypothetical protein SAMN02745866_00763 [Alteromonadaceae bacterium Bs31]|nr:hypothetical protein SAMN02745866_00763 [Alteromonadaceae bacterium Bs31]